MTPKETNKPITAEEKLELKIRKLLDANLYKKGLKSTIEFVVNQSMEYFKEYASIQCTEKDKEIERLKNELAKLWLHNKKEYYDLFKELRKELKITFDLYIAQRKVADKCQKQLEATKDMFTEAEVIALMVLSLAKPESITQILTEYKTQRNGK